MTFTSVGALVVPHDIRYTNLLTQTLDAEGEYVAFIMHIPKTGTLKKVCVGIGTVTTADPVEVRIETVSSGAPSGTLYATDSAGVISSPSVNTMYWVAINGATGISVTAGDLVAIKFILTYTDGNLLINFQNYMFFPTSSIPYASTYLGGSAAKVTANPNISFEYSDGIFACSTAICCTNTTTTLNNTSNPNRIGNMFKFPFGVGAIGFVGMIDADDNVDVILYDSSDDDPDFSTPLATVSLDSTTRGATSLYQQRVLFPSTIFLDKDKWYRIAVVPTTANNVGHNCTVFLDDGALHGIDAAPFGQNCIYTSCNGAPDAEADWTQDDTKRSSLALIIDQIDIPAAGGSSPVYGNQTGGK